MVTLNSVPTHGFKNRIENRSAQLKTGH